MRTAESVVALASAVPLEPVYELLAQTSKKTLRRRRSWRTKRWRTLKRRTTPPIQVEDDDDDDEEEHIYQILAKHVHSPAQKKSRVVPFDEPVLSDAIERQLEQLDAVNRKKREEARNERRDFLIIRLEKLARRMKHFKAWQVWLSFYRCSRENEAAMVLQGSLARYIERQRAATKHSDMLANAVIETAEKLRGYAAVIQAAFQRWCLRRKASRREQTRAAAAKVIQRTARFVKARRLGLISIASYHEQYFAATRIQQTARRRAARRLTKRMRTRARLRKSHARFATTSGAISYNFEQQGGAQRIQLWWGTLNWRVRLMEQRRVTTAVSVLKKAVQRFLFRKAVWRRVRSRRRWKIAMMKGEKRAAQRIQTVVRQFIDRRGAERTARIALEKRRLSRDAAIRQAQERLRHIHFHPIKARKLKKGVIALQRRHHARTNQKKSRRERNDNILRFYLLLQAWLRYRIKRGKRRRAAVVISKLLCAAWKKWRFQAKCATCIAKNWRRFAAFRHLRKLRHDLLTLAVTLNAHVRGILARRGVYRLIAEERILEEVALAGQAMFARTREREIQHQVAMQSSVVDPAHASELQRLFVFYCSYGDKGNVTRLGMSNFSRLAKDTPGLLAIRSTAKRKGKVNSSDMELIFMKSRGGKAIKDTAVDSHLQYRGFLAALRLLAEHLSIDFCSLVRDRLLLSSQAANIMQELGNLTFVGRADTRLAEAATRLTRMRRKQIARENVKKARKIACEHVDKYRRQAAVTTLQRWVRGLAGRLVAALIAMNLYEKLVDDEFGREFWFNPRTQEAMWDKPFVLAWLDVPNAVAMPGPDRLFDIRCASCNKRSSTHYFVEGKASYCSKCKDDKRHGEGGDAEFVETLRHTFIETEVCVQCRFQVGTKRCHQCKDDFCDTCYFAQHSRGSLQMHTYEELVPHCDECKNFAARKLIGTSFQTCLRCIPPQHKENTASLVDVPYVSKAVKTFYERLEEDKRRAQIEEENARRDIAIKTHREQRQIVAMQSMLRGWHCRLCIASFLKEKRIWLSRRKVDDRVRRQALYQIRDLFGIAPFLESDTDVETVMKSVPCWGRDSIRDIVDGKWTEFAGYRREQEAFLRAKGRLPATYVQLARNRATAAILSIERRLLLGRTWISRKRCERAHRKYRDARSLKLWNSEDLKTTMRKRRSEHEENWNRAEKSVAKIKILRERRRALLGPRRFKRRLREVARTGHAVESLTLSVRKYSKFAECSNPELFKPGVRLCISSNTGQKNVRVVKNTGRPSISQVIDIQIRRWKMSIAQYVSTIEGEEAMKGKAEELPRWTFDSNDLKKLCFNAMWTYDDSDVVSVRRYPRKRLSGQIFDAVSDTIRSSVLGQFPVKAEMAARCFMRRRLVMLSTRVDEGSEQEVWLIQRAEMQKTRCDRLSHLLVKEFDAERGFGIQATGKSAYWLAKTLFLKIPAYIIRREYAKYMPRDGDEQRRVYSFWEASKEKQTVDIEFEDSSAATVIGSIDIDLKCPLDVAREFIRRGHWGKLNKMTGTAYDFKDDEDIVEEDEEQKTMLSQIVVQRFDANVRDLRNCFRIATSETRGRTYLEPYVPTPRTRRRQQLSAEEEENLWSDDDDAFENP